jgi:hypothetical protein
MFFLYNGKHTDRQTSLRGLNTCKSELHLNYTEHCTPNTILLLNLEQSSKWPLWASAQLRACWHWHLREWLVSELWHSFVRILLLTSGTSKLQHNSASRVRTVCWYIKWFMPRSKPWLLKVRRSRRPVSRTTMTGPSNRQATSTYLQGRCQVKHSATQWVTRASCVDMGKHCCLF